ncbi:hypothetical protein BV25DRAFT_1920077 [Artomyces pyxidatus]|uniref:Uncharacterized protein n=1 Tax=Artomyces pyxidatus TaxID=48021 RepID=A0ACB8SNX2_9AGAM|nr:hypothetical protein BV25DRAFT_1920077 [Artomyces pyxidatus]
MVWTTPEQRELLLSYLPRHREFQARKCTKDFWPIVNAAWFAKWPEGYDCVIPNQPDVRKRIKQWYNNARGGNSTGNGRRVLNLTAKPPHKLHPYQAYQTLYWQSKLKPIVDAAWVEHVLAHPEHAKSGGLAFRNERCKALFAEESTEVREEVMRYCETDDDDDDDESSAGDDGVEKLRAFEE